MSETERPSAMTEQTRDEEQLEILGADSFDDPSLLDHLGDLQQVDQRHWPRRLIELLDIIVACLQRLHRHDSEAAHAEARNITLALANYFGGEQIYIPRGKELERALRDKAIWNDYDGRNHNELARRYKLSIPQIYNIIESQRRLHREKTQGSLF